MPASAGQARGEVLLPADGGRPFLDLYATVDHADVAAAKLFWPIHAMSPKAIEWLDRALVSGSVDSGAVLVRGSLADWPFRHNEGRFEARAAISDLTLDYGKDWPRAEHINAVASFVGNGMLVQASQGESLGVKAQRAVALIPDFGDGLLDLNVQGSGSGGDVMNFVRKSPIAAREADTLAQLKLGGSADFDFHLSLPLKPGSELQLTGNAAAQGCRPDGCATGSCSWTSSTVRCSSMRMGCSAGPLRRGFAASHRRVQMRLAGATGDPNVVLSASMDGRYSLAELVQDQPAIAWLGQVSEGRSDFRIGFDIARDSESAPWHQAHHLDSTCRASRSVCRRRWTSRPAATRRCMSACRCPTAARRSAGIAGADTAWRVSACRASMTSRSAARCSWARRCLMRCRRKGLRVRGHADAPGCHRLGPAHAWPAATAPARRRWKAST